MSTCNRLDLQTLGYLSTEYAQKSSQTLIQVNSLFFGHSNRVISKGENIIIEQ